MHLHELKLNEPLMDHPLANDAPSMIAIVQKRLNHTVMAKSGLIATGRRGKPDVCEAAHGRSSGVPLRPYTYNLYIWFMEHFTGEFMK